MSRKERRAVSSKIKKIPSPPNISGTGECCANCKFSPDPQRVKTIATIMGARALVIGQPPPQPPPDDEVFCLNEPQERTKKVFGWCGRWESRDA